MENENLQTVCCEDGGEFRVNCDICDKLCIERVYKSHHKSPTHTENFRKKIL